MADRLAVFLKDSLAPLFFPLPALLLWLFVSGFRSRRSGSLSSFQASVLLSVFLVLLYDLFQVFVAIALDPVQVFAA